MDRLTGPDLGVLVTVAGLLVGVAVGVLLASSRIEVDFVTDCSACGA